MFQTAQAVYTAVGLTLALVLTAMLVRPDDRVTSRSMLVVALVAGLVELIFGNLSALLGAQAISWLRDIVGVVLSATLLRMAGMLLFRVLMPLLRLHPARIIEDLTVTAAFIAWMLLWWRMAGVNLSSIMATSAVVTAIIAFSMQETLGNILGGVALQLDNSIRLGDWVKIDDVSGKVVEIRWRFTAIETRNRETLVVPNGYLMKNRFLVLGSRRDQKPVWRRWVWFNLAVDKGVTRVIAVLEQAVADGHIPCVAKDPPPNAVLMEVLPNGGRFALRYWLEDFQRDDPTDSDVRTHVHAALRRAGIPVIMPIAERMLVNDDENARASAAAREHARRIEILGRVDLFRGLTPAELDKLAHHLIPAPFIKGDDITRQGAMAHWLYLINSGECDVWRELEGGERRHLATLQAGNVFGEMGLMTGQPRRATVSAKTDVDCYRLDKEGFRAILAARPDFARDISGVLVDRNNDLLAKQNAEAHEVRAQDHNDLVDQIKSFFAIR
ncbi:MAG: mechanosensitive ion channel family protein [Burkholderiales bacterium]|nr:mechanosensitive ion channel family protein [Burkholderiales bacterium]